MQAIKQAKHMAVIIKQSREAALVPILLPIRPYEPMNCLSMEYK